MSELKIDYSTFTTIVIGLFALSGFFRGWWREGISTLFLVLLVFLLTQPQDAQNVINTLNNLIKDALALSRVGLVATPQAVGAAAAGVSSPVALDPRDRTLYIIILVILVGLSYFTGGLALGQRQITAGGRIAGGALGAFNGFVVINLVKEYIVGRFLPGAQLSAQSASIPSMLSVTVANVPPDTTLVGTPQLLVFGIGALVVVLMVGTHFGRKGGHGPWGYGMALVPKKEEKRS
jgi:hypothetical protein